MARILVVDDNPDIRETLQYTFEQQGHEVRSVADGRAALETARETPPDLAVLDVMLPGLNGYEVSRHLKSDMQQGALEPFPILLLTARRVANGARQDLLTLWSRADATLWKPYDLGVLTVQVRELLGEARITDAGDAT